MNGPTRIRLKICVVSSIGGHLDEVMQLYPVIRGHDHFFVVNAEGSLPEEIRDCSLRVVHSERDWKFLVNLWEAARILFTNRPDVIVSCGAGPAVSFALVGKILGAKVVFVETFTAVKRPSFSGRLVYSLADLFIYQWSTLSSAYPKGIFGGTIF